ncbi:MAG: hypothetical protein LBI36_05795 [Oscillospiraceae bacterium]|jgi:hypothetical protein|nr:hypothetical protein [Oscillospiraceae bacterium]
MEAEYTCPLVNTEIDETICYDIQMVIGPGGGLINKSILNDFADIFDAGMVTDERAAITCPGCSFNQLKQTERKRAAV